MADLFRKFKSSFLILTKKILHMEKSRKYMLVATALLFVSQFFAYSKREFTRPMTDGITGNYYGGMLTSSETGWQWHSWYLAVILGIIAYIFYSKTRSLVYYFVSIIVLLASALGTGMGANMGIIGVLIAGYSIYLKRKETKITPGPKSIITSS